MKKIIGVIVACFMVTILEIVVCRTFELLIIFGIPIIIGVSGVIFTREMIAPELFSALFIYPIVFIVGAAASLVLTIKIAKEIKNRA